MFAKATAKFVRQIDPEGSLIHVSRVNDSHKLVPMALVVKRKRLWPWQKPKYQPTDFTLSELLQGDKVLTPGVCTTEFLTYKGTYGDQLSHSLNTKAGYVNVTLEGRGTSKLQSSFGQLKKENLNVKKLLSDSINRLVDMRHVLVQQLEKRADVLAVVKERILTASSCSVTQTEKEQCLFQGVLGLVGLLGNTVKVCVKDNNNFRQDSDVSLEIPSGTVIAYSVLELEIKKDGHYDICLQPGAIGGFEADSTLRSWPADDSFCTVDGKLNGKAFPDTADQSALQNESLAIDLSPLAELPKSSRCTFVKSLKETLMDRPALSYLQCVLEEMCSGETLNMTTKDERDQPDSSENGQHGVVSAHLNAAYLLVSALEELPDETLNLLSKSRPEFLEAFNILMCRLKESSSEPVSIHSLPALLQDNQTFQQAEQLLSSTNVTLRRDSDLVWKDAGDNVGVLPVVLSLSVRGLVLMGSGLK
ncbi:gasdermin-E-like [Pholidichthys leucotaenia]